MTAPRVRLNRPEPLHQQVARNIRNEIEAGVLRHEEVLPSTRELAADWDASVFTISEAMKLLMQEGLVVSKSRSKHVVNAPNQARRTEVRTCKPHVLLIGGYAGKSGLWKAKAGRGSGIELGATVRVVVGDGERQIHGLTDDMYGHVVETDVAVVQFMLGGGEDPETVNNVDAHIYLADGSHRYANFFTLDAVKEILRRHASTGETDGGRYFWCSDQVIVPEQGVAAMVAAVDEMVRSGDIEVMCSRIEEDTEGIPGHTGGTRHREVSSTSEQL